MATYHYDIFADYHQIYLEDCGICHARTALDGRDPAVRASEIDAWVATLLTKEAHARHLGVAHGTLCILTARNSTVPLDVEVCPTPLEPDPGEFAAWDQVMEASLDLPSGCLEVSGVGDVLGLRQVQVESGTYRARIYYGGVDTVSKDRLQGADHYRAVLWPDPVPLQLPVMLHSHDPCIW
jgi:hypothetical protein